MDGLIFLVLLLMLLIGFAQVVSAIVLLITTKQDHVREHFAYYLGGVALYFALMYPLAELSQSIGEFYGAVYFFSGALGLMIYHISILFMRRARPRVHY